MDISHRHFLKSDLASTVPLVAPRIRTSSLSVGTITVDWSPLLAREKRGVITQYKIYFQKVDGGREQTNVIHNNTTTYTIHGKPDFWFWGGEGVKKGECIGKEKKKWDESFWEQVLLSVELLNFMWTNFRALSIINIL